MCVCVCGGGGGGGEGVVGGAWQQREREVQKQAPNRKPRLTALNMQKSEVSRDIH